MTSQRLLKLLALVSIATSIAAFWLWRSTGETPSPWLMRASIAAFAGALLAGLICEVTRPRLMLRFLASLFALIAVIAFAADFSHTGGSFKATSLMGHLNDFAPSLLTSAKNAMSHSPLPFLWDPLLTTLLSYPTFAIFAALALTAGLASRPRREVRIFVN